MGCLELLSYILQARLASSQLAALDLTQTLDIAGATALTVSSHTNGSVFVACQAGSQSSIHHLVAAPLNQQAEALADLGDFPSALELASLLPDSQVRFTTIGIIHDKHQVASSRQQFA